MSVEVLLMLVLIVLPWSRLHHWTNRAIRAEAALDRIEASISGCQAIVGEDK